MTCANWILSLAAVVIFVLTIWPTLLGGATIWVVLIAAIAVLIVALTGVECRWCSEKEQAKKKRR